MSDLLHSFGKKLLSVVPSVNHNTKHSTSTTPTKDKNANSGEAKASSDGHDLPPVRRIVTGHNSKGLGNVKWDTLIPGQEAGLVGCKGLRSGALWTTDRVPSNDTNVNVDGALRSIGGQGLVMREGTNLRFTDLAPGESSPMHRTSSVDYNTLITGKLILITDSGSETLLSNPGDTVVMRGSMHAWRNPGPGWCRWNNIMIVSHEE